MKTSEEKRLIVEFHNQWKSLWRSKLDDRVQREGIAGEDFSLLFIEKGTVIKATREMKPLNFEEILRRHKEKYNINMPLHIDPSEGGWRKFSQTIAASYSKPRKQAFIEETKEEKNNQQMKKGGRGWIHIKP